MKELIKKYKELILYMTFGAMTFLISVGSFAFFSKILTINTLLSNAFAWIFAVLFSYYTNRIWVFKAVTKGKRDLLRQMFSFFGARFTTLVIEEAMLLILVEIMQYEEVTIKLIAQIVVISLNYLFSKLIVFRKKK